MIALFHVASGPDQGRDFLVIEDYTMVFGRDEANDGRLTDPDVAPIHCRAELKEGRLLLSDAGSGSGTRVNGKLVTVRELQPGDAVRIGGTQMGFRWVTLQEIATLSTTLPPVDS